MSGGAPCLDTVSRERQQKTSAENLNPPARINLTAVPSPRVHHPHTGIFPPPPKLPPKSGVYGSSPEADRPRYFTLSMLSAGARRWLPRGAFLTGQKDGSQHGPAALSSGRRGGRRLKREEPEASQPAPLPLAVGFHRRPSRTETPSRPKPQEGCTDPSPSPEACQPTRGGQNSGLHFGSVPRFEGRNFEPLPCPGWLERLRRFSSSSPVKRVQTIKREGEAG
ncbi:hypothetical protein B0T11DRAFT_87847 [Plectosphaerella cucumerina]|uniref:Uncharacterized protein n=1 Tax=Plectosphaerella cucumerina TaxID=40658 RepID=A0A8K0THK6_9PEZI|nr:hypothetical protein B0T11DRAFT_87847 [Plectosphaerella cucumerina]